MRREEPDLPYSNSRRVAYDHSDDERHVTYHMGRAFLNESSNRVPKYGVTPDDLKAMRAHQLAEAEYRQARAVANLARAVELGAALKVLAGKDD